jgi:uncharacterized protein YndB with AHSA1/START domain
MMAHRTSTLEKVFSVKPEKVFAAWRDVEMRAEWNSPSDEVEIRMEEADFREGGRDVSLCLVEGHEVAHVTSTYHEIVDNQRIIFTEAIRGDDVMQGVSLVSVGFYEEGASTRMTVTLQTVAVDGGALLDEVIVGWEAALIRMERLFV